MENDRHFLKKRGKREKETENLVMVGLKIGDQEKERGLGENSSKETNYFCKE